MKNLWNKVKGFTIVEIIVVVAIIAILLAIFMPSIQRMMEMSARAH